MLDLLPPVAFSSRGDHQHVVVLPGMVPRVARLRAGEGVPVQHIHVHSQRVRHRAGEQRSGGCRPEPGQLTAEFIIPGEVVAPARRRSAAECRQELTGVHAEHLRRSEAGRHLGKSAWSLPASVLYEQQGRAGPAAGRAGGEVRRHVERVADAVAGYYEQRTVRQPTFEVRGEGGAQAFLDP
jgi:hypothetical protein